MTSNPFVPASRIALRPYQQEALAAIAETEAKGIRRHLIAPPTGIGKTVIFPHVVWGRTGRALVLAHREELIGQAAEKILTVNPAHRSGSGGVRIAGSSLRLWRQVKAAEREGRHLPPAVSRGR